MRVIFQERQLINEYIRIPLDNIRTVEQNQDHNLFIQTHRPVDFQTYHYASNNTHSLITMVQVAHPNAVQRRIQNQLNKARSNDKHLE